jgi:hypothetical protein
MHIKTYAVILPVILVTGEWRAGLTWSSLDKQSKDTCWPRAMVSSQGLLFHFGCVLLTPRGKCGPLPSSFHPHFSTYEMKSFHSFHCLFLCDTSGLGTRNKKWSCPSVNDYTSREGMCEQKGTRGKGQSQAGLEHRREGSGFRRGPKVLYPCDRFFSQPMFSPPTDLLVLCLG